MSRRKQANPAKLGDTEVKMKVTNEDCSSSKVLDDSSDEKEYNVEEDDDSDASELREIDNGCLENEDFDEVSIMLNGRASSPSSSNRSSPTSCRSFTLSDVTDGDESYTVGATATNPYECNKCKRAFSRSSELSKHIQIHTDQLQFSCSYCRRLFKHKRSRDRHTKLHTGDKKYKCTQCESAFARSDHLKIHMKTHDNKKPHQCELCNRGYNTAAALASHQQHHVKKEVRCGSSASTATAVSTPSPGYLRCSQCSESFSKPEQLQNHQQSKHKSISAIINQNPSTPDKNLNVDQPKDESNMEFTKVACMYCGRDFPNMNQMYQHISADHSAIFLTHNLSYNPQISPSSKDSFQKTNLPSYACDLCTIKCETAQSLKEHFKNNHWKIGSNQSSESTPSGLQSRPTDLSRKRRVEESEENDKRKLEEKKTSPSSSSPYDSNDKPCICSYCYVQMPNFKSFLIHMESHVSLNASNSFIGYCPICGEPSRDSIEFSSHIFSHVVTDITGRCCHQCKKSFDQLEQLQKHHLEVHSQNVYKCTICGELFESEIAIKVHFNNRHCTECKHYRCNLCSQQYFHDKLTAELHVSMRHGNQLSSARPEHHRHIYGRTEMDSRMMYRTYQCPFCQKSFRDAYMQKYHILKEHESADGRKADNLLMDVCGLSTGSPSFSYRSLSSPTPLLPQENLQIDSKQIASHTCEICHRTDFTTEAELVSHMKIHQATHAKSKVGTVSLQCAYCNEHCKSRSDLENHMKGHQVSCGAITLADHKLTHCKIVSANTCTQCKTVLGDEQCYYSHQLQHNTSSTLSKSNSQMTLPANCVICCQTLQTDIEVKLHAKFHLRHLLQKEFICAICNKVCDSREISDKSNGASIAICKNCKSKNGIELEFLRVQQPRQEVEYNIHCRRAFDKATEGVKINQSLEEIDRLRCRLCRSILPSISKLQIHLIEHNFMGMGQFRCYICSSVFTTAAGLQAHIIGHGLGQSPYECVECKMKFFFETELENHRISHVLSSNAQVDEMSSSSSVFGEKVQNEKQYKVCCYCSGTFLDVCFAEHVENCCKVEIKTEIYNDDYENKDNCQNEGQNLEGIAKEENEG
ncbi:putative metal ion binding protein [Trypoxylus dichotomus]